MSLGQVLYVNVITDCRSIRRRIIGPIDVDVRPLFEGRLQHQRNEMGFGLVNFTDLTLGIGSRRIEIA